MNLKSVEKPEKNVVEIEVEVGAEEFEEAVERAFKKNIGKLNVQGFRKGRAPRKFVEKIYGESVFYEEAVNSSYPEAYEEAIEKAGIEPVDKADIEIISVGKEGYTFKAKVTVKPEVKLGRYKGVKVEKEAVKVTDEDVNSELSNIQKKYARLVSVTDRPSRLDDIVIIDYEGSVDGVPFEGGKAENHNLKLGSDQFIPGFEEQLIGKNIGGEADVNVTFPEEYHTEELKGKKALFKVKINDIKFSELPALDDEFAKDASEFDTLDEFKASLKEKITHSREHSAENDVENKIIDEVVAFMTAEIPDIMIEKQIDNMAADYNQRLGMQGLDINTYLSYTGMDIEGFRKMFREQAEKQVKSRLALEKIAETEKIVVSEEEISEEIKKIAEAYQMEPEKIKMYVPVSDIAKDIAAGKAIEFLKANAVVTTVEKKAETPIKKTEKKSAAKKVKGKAE